MNAYLLIHIIGPLTQQAVQTNTTVYHTKLRYLFWWLFVWIIFLMFCKSHYIHSLSGIWMIDGSQKTGYLVCFCCFKYSARKSGKKTLFFKKDKTDMIYWIFFQSTYQIYYVLVNLNVSLNHIIINLFKCVIYGLYLCS